MKAALLFLLWFFCRTSAGRRASVIVTPDRSQYFEYEHFIVSCRPFDSGKWTVWRYTTDGLKLSQCGSGWGVHASSTCSMMTVKPSTSGVYWCQSDQSDSSNAVNITVTDQPVILQSPVLPVTEGHDVTLRCRTRSPPSELPARFYKDGSLVGTEPTGHMTVRRFSRSHEGAYKCEIEGHGESPPSWLLMKEDSAAVSVTASPDTSQWYEYENLTLSCNDNSRRQGWTVKRSQTSGGRMSSCREEWGGPTASGCFIQTAKQSDSAVYWCESPARQRSNSINITIYGADTPVILQSPVLPVTEGHDVTLRCRTRSPPSELPARFYKDGFLVGTEPTGHMTVRRVTRSDQGLYRCDVGGRESPSSPLMVRANDSSSSVRHETAPSLTVVRHILVCSPYFVCTVLGLSVCRRKPSGRVPPVPMTTPPHDEDDDEADPQYDDVTTEHRF